MENLDLNSLEEVLSSLGIQAKNNKIKKSDFLRLVTAEDDFDPEDITRLEFIKGTSNKFWEFVDLGNGDALTRWGRIGATKGQSKVVPLEQAEKKAKSKENKGYELVASLVAIARGRKDIKEAEKTLDILKSVEKTLNYGKRELDRLCKSKSDIMCDLTEKMGELMDQIKENKDATEKKFSELKSDKAMLDSVVY